MEFKNLNETVQLSIKRMNELIEKKALTPEEISTFKVLSDFVVTTINREELQTRYDAHEEPHRVYQQMSAKN